MRGIVDAGAFSEALEKVSLVLKKMILPELEGVYIRFSNGCCTLAASDMETWMTAQVPARGDDFALVLGEVKAVRKACRYFSGELSIELTEMGEGKNRRYQATLRCGARGGEFEAYSNDQFPDIPTLQGEANFTVNAAELLARINRVAYATRKPDQSTREMRCCVEFKGNQIYAVDGYRAAWDTDDSLIFPRPFLALPGPLSCLKVFGNAQVEARLETPRIQFSDGRTTLLLRWGMDVPFELDHAVPKNFVGEYIVSPKDFLSELNYLKEVSPKTLKAYVCLRDGALYMQAAGRNFQTRVEMEGGNAFSVGFDLRYMADALKQFEKADQVSVKISGESSPIVIQAEGRSDCALVLPVRIKEEMAA